VVHFKRQVYRRALCELVPLMFPELEQDRTGGGEGCRVTDPIIHSPVPSR